MLKLSQVYFVSLTFLAACGVLGMPITDTSAAAAVDKKGHNNERATTASEAPISAKALSLLFDTDSLDAIPKSAKAKTKPRRSHLESAIGCPNFVCLLSKFDLLKSEGGYILTPLEDFPVRKVNKDCKKYDCWLGQFDAKEKSYGWELTYKPAKEENKKDTKNKEAVSAKSGKSTEPAWALDTVGGLMIPKTSSSERSQSNSQKSPVLDFDTLFS